MIIFDLDDTLANTTHRQHLLLEGSSSWDEFYKAGINDEPMVHLRNLRNFAQMGTSIMIWSGRGTVARQATIDWLFTNGVAVKDEKPTEGVVSNVPNLVEIDGLFMRATGDRTKGWLLKERWLLQHNQLFPGNKVTMAFDDDPKAIAMYEMHGVAAFKVIGGFERHAS